MPDADLFNLLQASPAWTWIIVHHLRDQEARFWHGESDTLLTRVTAFGEDARPDRNEHPHSDTSSAASSGGTTEVLAADESGGTGGGL